MTKYKKVYEFYQYLWGSFTVFGKVFFFPLFILMFPLITIVSLSVKDKDYE